MPLRGFSIAVPPFPNPLFLAQITQQHFAQPLLVRDAIDSGYSHRQAQQPVNNIHDHQIQWLSGQLFQAIIRLASEVDLGELAKNEFA